MPKDTNKCLEFALFQKVLLPLQPRKLKLPYNNIIYGGLIMNVNPNTALELNALYGEMTSNITQIKNIDLLKKMNEMIKNFISKAHTSQSQEFVPRSKEELLDGFDKACKEVKLFQEGKTKLMSFDDMMDQLKKEI